MNYKLDPTLQDSKDLGLGERFNRGFLRETGHGLVPLVGSLTMGYVIFIVFNGLVSLRWSDIRAVVFGY